MSGRKRIRYTPESDSDYVQSDSEETIPEDKNEPIKNQEFIKLKSGTYLSVFWTMENKWYQGTLLTIYRRGKHCSVKIGYDDGQLVKSKLKDISDWKIIKRSESTTEHILTFKEECVTRNVLCGYYVYTVNKSTGNICMSVPSNRQLKYSSYITRPETVLEHSKNNENELGKMWIESAPNPNSVPNPNRKWWSTPTKSTQPTQPTQPTQIIAQPSQSMQSVQSFREDGEFSLDAEIAAQEARLKFLKDQKNHQDHKSFQVKIKKYMDSIDELSIFMKNITKSIKELLSGVNYSKPCPLTIHNKISLYHSINAKPMDETTQPLTLQQSSQSTQSSQSSPYTKFEEKIKTEIDAKLAEILKENNIQRVNLCNELLSSIDEFIDKRNIALSILSELKTSVNMKNCFFSEFYDKYANDFPPNSYEIFANWTIAARFSKDFTEQIVNKGG